MRSGLFLAVDFVLSRDLELRATASWMESMDRPASLSLGFMGAHFNGHSWLRRSGQRRLEIQHRFQTEAIFIFFFSYTLFSVFSLFGPIYEPQGWYWISSPRGLSTSLESTWLGFHSDVLD